MTIHKEGFVSIAIAAGFLTLLNLFFEYILSDFQWIAKTILVLSILFFLTIIYFFRKPHLVIEKNDRHVLSPADGTVVAIEETLDTEYFNDKRLQISVFMSPLNVHMNRYPISGTVKYFEHHNGHFHVAWHPKSSVENEHTTTVIHHDNGAEILFKQIAGAVARRIVNYASLSERIDQGSECGFIKFGSRVDVLVPIGTKVNVQIGDKVYGGKTVLALFP